MCVRYYKKYFIAVILMFFISFCSAQDFYLLSSDSNNCQYDKSHRYVTGWDCVCAAISSHSKPDWRINWDEPSCFLQSRSKQGVGYGQVHRSIKDCDNKDVHCSQFDCLKTLFYDNTEHTALNATLHRYQCTDKQGESLPITDAQGHFEKSNK